MRLLADDLRVRARHRKAVAGDRRDVTGLHTAGTQVNANLPEPDRLSSPGHAKAATLTAAENASMADLHQLAADITRFSAKSVEGGRHDGP